MALRSLLTCIGFWLAVACTPQLSLTNESKDSSVTIDTHIEPDATAVATIAPYKARLDKEMKTLIGQVNHRLEKQLVESNLGNLVSDIILEQAGPYYEEEIDISIVSYIEINSPLAQGHVYKGDIYELMPAEYKLQILELGASEIQDLVSYQAENKNLSFGNAVLVIKDQRPYKFYIDGQPFDQNQTYTLAVSDFLANGGGGMNFLRRAKPLQKPEITIRDLIFNYMSSRQKAGKAIDARIEGRIKILP